MHSFYPSSNSVSETVVVTVLVVCGALMWTYVLAKFCDVATNSDPGLTAFRQTVDALNELIRSYQVPTASTRRRSKTNVAAAAACTSLPLLPSCRCFSAAADSLLRLPLTSY